MFEADTPEDALTTFVSLLSVEPAGGDVFTGDPGRDEGRVFGGLVLGQAVIAAGRTAPDPTLHSIHAYFLRGGRPDAPIDYHVERVRDGRTFSSRRILARQRGEAICDITASYVHAEDGISHQEPAPDVPDPETLPDARIEYPMEDGSLWPLGPIEWRVSQPFDKVAGPGESTIVEEWARFRVPLPDDPLLHEAALVLASDMGSFNGIERRYGWAGFSDRGSASLDHAMWIHRPVRWDGWMLMITNTPVAHAARALTYRQFYLRDGTHVASMAQEAIFRRERGA